MNTKPHPLLGTPGWLFHLLTIGCAYVSLSESLFRWIGKPAHWWAETDLFFFLLESPLRLWFLLVTLWLIKLYYNLSQFLPLRGMSPLAYALSWWFMPLMFFTTLHLLNTNQHFHLAVALSRSSMNAAAQDIMTTKGSSPDRRMGLFKAHGITRIGSGFTFQSRTETPFISHFEYGFSYFPDNKVPAGWKFPRYFGESNPNPKHIHLFGPWYVWKEHGLDF